MIKFAKQFILSILFLSLITTVTFAQTEVKEDLGSTKTETPKDWHLLDRNKTGHYGISLDKAYDFLKGRKSKQVIVAVIDSGIDTLQEDLKPILWRNPGEIPGNGIDDDKNGYVDDVYGWNFLGNKDGQNVKEDSYEGARVYWNLKEKYYGKTIDTTQMNATEKLEYTTFLRAKGNVVDDIDPAELLMMQRLLPPLKRGDSIIMKSLGKNTYDGNDLKKYSPFAPDAKVATSIMLDMCEMNNSFDITNNDIVAFFSGKVRKGKSSQAPPQNFRNDIVKDNYDDINDRFYGNPDVMAGTPSHGTHCSGIIGAVRDNNLGMNGIADNVRIMMLRAVPDGDEHDKDIANAIRYAVDNGARVISMSFGKSFSPQKSWVDDAVKYAASKNVLLVQAAGNDSKNNDSTFNFPSPEYLNNSGRAKNYITVGANGDISNGGFTASFSNYGKKEVDVFAPGVGIYSTLPGGDKYGSMSGTSMAAPVVAGLGALLLQYFPDLSAEQVKYVIEKSVSPITEKVTLPGSEELVSLSEISKTGGEINAYSAVKLAATLKGDRDLDKEILPKSKIKKQKKG
ncbi:MAG: S8 family serine peptidase [Ginsengibacter sp.]